MQTIQASYIFHRKEQRIRLQFENYDLMNNLVKKISGVRWSKTYKSWHMPCDKKLYSNFKKALPDTWALTELKQTTDPVARQAKPLPPPLPKAIAAKSPPANIKPVNGNKILPSSLHPINQQALEKYLQCLQLKSYSASTIKTYRTEFMALLQILKTKDASTLSADDVKRYMLYCVNTLHLSENSLHSRINAFHPVGLKK